MQLRPHHLLCIQKFTGHGYDAAFTAHMAQTVHLLLSRPETAVTLVNGADTLCAVCPHLKNGICGSAEKTASLDSAVLLACGFSAGMQATWQHLSQRAAALLQTPEFDRICICCSWYGLCRETGGQHEEPAENT